MIVVEIAKERCKGCELCIIICPLGCLKLDQKVINSQGFHPTMFNYLGDKGKCTACGLCYLICPDYAITTIKKRIERNVNNGD
jgi:2-oxoglutarate ferredoxin oxidoreductase subunit delta